MFNLEHAGVDEVLKGLMSSRMQTIDRYVTSELKGLGSDVMALSIQQARDHGIPSEFTVV